MASPIGVHDLRIFGEERNLEAVVVEHKVRMFCELPDSLAACVIAGVGDEPCCDKDADGKKKPAW